MRQIRGVAQHYAWGDPTAIPRILGRSADGLPWAEWWLGTHPAFADIPIIRKRVDGAKLGCVLSNSFGFGGTNATIALKHPDA